jgi:DNA-binding transcriptional regulator LsrR (DeoR family)
MTRYSAETKAQAAADLLAGMTVREVAAKYGMSRSTVGNLTRTSKAGAVYVQRIMDINDLQHKFLEQLDHNFAALTAMTELIVAEPKYAAEHGNNLAVLYGVVFDKTGKLAGAAVAGAGLDRPALPDARPAQPDHDEPENTP